MKFWDASAIVPLLVQEMATDFVLALVTKDPTMLVWWGSRVECVSALARLEREGALDRGRADLAFARLDALAEALARSRADRGRARKRDPVSPRSPRLGRSIPIA